VPKIIYNRARPTSYKNIKLILCRNRSRQSDRPAGGYDYYQGYNHISQLYFCEETLDKSKIYAENGNNKRQNRNNNQDGTQKTAGRLDIEGLEDFALGKGKRCSSHSAGRARQAGLLFEAAITEPSTHIDLIMSRYCKYTEEKNYPHADNRRRHPPAGRCTRNRRQTTDNRKQTTEDRRQKTEDRRLRDLCPLPSDF
jgi:hypothetical protein